MIDLTPPEMETCVPGFSFGPGQSNSHQELAASSSEQPKPMLFIIRQQKHAGSKVRPAKSTQTLRQRQTPVKPLLYPLFSLSSGEEINSWMFLFPCCAVVIPHVNIWVVPAHSTEAPLWHRRANKMSTCFAGVLFQCMGREM